MNIEQFYEENADRRDSEELEFGTEWVDDAGNPCELAWVERTGELYVMTETDFPRVEILGIAATRSEVEHLLAGWPEAMREDGRLAWVRDRVTGRTHAPPGISSSMQPRDLSGAFTFEEPLDRGYRLKLTLVMGFGAGAALTLIGFALKKPFTLDLFIGPLIGITIYMWCTPMGRQLSEDGQRARAMTRAIGRSGRREVRRAVRDGRAVAEPRLARYAVRSAERQQVLLTQRLYVWPSLVMLALAAWAFAYGRMAAGVIAVVLAALPPLIRWATHAKRLARVEAALAANRPLVES